MQPVDFQYLNVLQETFEDGFLQTDRTDVGSSTQIFAKSILFDTQDKYAPFVQARTFSPKLSFNEWKWMMGGNTDSQWLEDRGVYIWQGNTTREFLDSRGLYNVPEKNVGKSYGYQFVNFNGVNQLEKVFKSLRDDPTSRDHVISIWNPAELDEAPLKPCAFLYEFMTQGDILHLHIHMRSADFCYGVPYNLAFATYFLFGYARALGYKTGKIWWTGTNTHIYSNQMDIAKELLKNRDEGLIGNVTENKIKAPTLKLNKSISTLDDIINLEFEDFEIGDFIRGPKIGDAKMAV